MAVQIAYFIITICSAVVLGQTSVEMIHYDILDGKRCNTPLFSVAVQSKIACAARCIMDGSCKSEFFLPGTRMCIGCDSVYQVSDLTALVDEPGAVYYRPYAFYNQSCSSNDKPCIENKTVCFSGADVCVCEPFLVYDPGTASCNSGCSVYGNTYQRYPNRVVTANDGYYHGSQNDPANCLSYCTNINTFTCFGVDYDTIRKICYYNNAKPAITGWNVDNSLDLYIRNCA